MSFYLNFNVYKYHEKNYQSPCSFPFCFSMFVNEMKWDFLKTFILTIFSGWTERCSIACICQQTRSSKCNECCRNYWQVGSSLSETAPLVSILMMKRIVSSIDWKLLRSKILFWFFQVHPEHLCNLWGGSLWRFGLAFQQHSQ